MSVQTIIYTIGYQGRSLAEIRQLMQAHGVELLIDVRSKPYGRRVEFNRKALEAALSSYRWMGDRLGGFAEITGQAIADLAEIARSRQSLIMCMERDPDQCHRKSELATRLRVHGIEAVHL